MAAKVKENVLETKKVNPVFEYFTKFRGQVFVNDPALLL